MWLPTLLGLVTLIQLGRTQDTCKDANKYCVQYKQQNYCDSSNQYHTFMKGNCALTCGFCKLTTTAKPGECKDIDVDCDYYKDENYCDSSNEYYSFMKDNCALACGFCKTTNPTKRPKPTKPTKPVDCKDSDDDCNYYKGQNYCDSSNEYYSFMKSSCALTCGFCKTTNPTKPTKPTKRACKNKNDNCPTWKVYCKPTSKHWDYMKENCRKTCDICKDEGGGGSGKKDLSCDFETDICQWINEPLDDDADWKVDGSAKYAYVGTTSSGFKARLMLPLELALPDGVTNKGPMCMKFKYQTGSGTLKVIDERYPTAKNKNPSQRILVTLQGRASWVEASVLVTVDNKRKIVLEGKTGSNGRVAVDNVGFVSGRC